MNSTKRQSVPKVPETKQGLTRWTKNVRPAPKTAAHYILRCLRTTVHVQTNNTACMSYHVARQPPSKGLHNRHPTKKTGLF